MLKKQSPTDEHVFFNLKNSLVAFLLANLFHISVWGYFFMSHVETLFEQDLLKKAAPIYGLMVSQGDELLSMTYKLIHSGLAIILFLLSVALLFYLITLIKQTLVMENNQLRTKKLLAASNTRVTVEHLFDYAIPFLVGYCGSLIMTSYFFNKLFQSSSEFLGLKRLNLTKVMIQSHAISIPYLVMLLLLIYSFTYAQIKRMTD